MKFVIRYFLRGLLFVVPTALTVYLIWISVEFLDGILQLEIPGLGLVIILGSIMLLGLLGSTLLARPIFTAFESLMERLPLINIIYTSLNDLITAFVGEKRKFDKPVTVQLTADGNLFKMGFITKEDLSELDLPGMVSVYLPHSYNFSGNHFLVSKQYVKPVNASAVDMMKFIVSGGVSEIRTKEKKQ